MRTVLYAHRDISSFLTENYVLLWTSERPVPRITIDFGDGRTLERTITGNSVHYVLDAQGRPLDAIPGLYAPTAFLEHLHSAKNLHGALASDDRDNIRDNILRDYHDVRLTEVTGRFAAAITAAGKDALQPELEMRPAVEKPPGAEEAVRIAVGKSGVERPMLRLILRHDRAKLEAAADADVWRQIVASNAKLGALDTRSIALMARELPGVEITPEMLTRVGASTDPFAAERAARRAMSKSFRGGEMDMITMLTPVENSLAALVAGFQNSLVEDTLRNEYLLHAQVHEWFIAGTQELDVLNERVFRELFLTPRNDPWLGLAPADAFTGITHGGLKQ